MSTHLRTITFACLLFAGFVFTANIAAAQTKISTPAGLFKTGNYLEGTSTNDGTTLFCTDAATFTLVSSTTDPENNVPYTNYVWEEMNENGTTFTSMPAVSGANNKMKVDNASAGWHIYKVTATTGIATGCEPEPTFYTVYVLPKLKVTPRVNRTDAQGVSYCSENDAPSGAAAFVFSSVVEFVGTPRAIAGTTLPTLDVDDFELQYAWFKVETSSTRVPVGTNSETYTLEDPATPGTNETYSVELDVKYAAKTACSYTANSLHSGTSTTPVVVKVYRKAGKPTITIE